MLKKSMGFILGSVVMKSSFAMVIQHGAIIDHREWATGNTPIQMKEHPHHGNKKFIKSFLHHKKDLFGDREGIILANRIEDGLEGAVGTDTEMGGTLKVYIENFTQIAQTYRIASNFCITSALDLDMNPCYHSIYKFELAPHGIFELDVARGFIYNFPHAGTYAAGFYLTADRENGATDFATYALGEISIGED